MDNNDILITTLSENKKIYGYLAITKNTAEQAQKNHNMNIISSAIFCRALTATVLLGGNLKNSKDILTLRWNCTGPVKSILIETTGEGNVKGYIGNNNLQLIEDSIFDNTIKAEPYIGFGELNVTRNSIDGKQPYSSVTVIETGEIAEDISLYLEQSLQIQSAIKIGLSINKDNQIEASGGLLLIAMPDATEEDVKKIHSSFENIHSFTEILNSNIEETEIIKKFLSDLKLEIISTKNIQFKCTCDENKIKGFLKTLKKEEFTEYITEEGKIDAECQYCGRKYSFSPQDLEN
ncbi:MAG: hypothetical protein A2086_02210 [Spirochaetes bacterium GWD1_27_9]|nr:MAG: hypothetical protein A2Z98_14690 [Spirochaetes bacterium GWB1_27_13]OHD25724.1 MAG: hypothetical protein A2Y34_13135 [Spirochaetes bacterium GWC1_27_15]OHD33097.1 MAG: hypothetical protein A2086_02210 [Spirochaetes bacterium GWD1_27_9]